MPDTFLVAIERCPLCESTRKKFTCSICIKGGTFLHTLYPDSGTYAEKSQRIIDLLETRNLLKETIRKFAGNITGLEQKKAEKLRLGQKVRTLQTVVKSLNRDILTEQNDLHQRKEQYEARLKELENFKSSEGEYVCEISRCKKKSSELKGILNDTQLKLIKVRAISVQRLKEDIFPITVRPTYKDFGTPPGETLATRGLFNDLVVETSSSPEVDLEEATTCQYKEGEWVQTSLAENSYCIAGCGMPPFGDYFKYFEWMKSYRKDARGSEEDGNMHNRPGLEIPAALIYMCQILTVSSKILGINLPYKVSYKDLGSPHIHQQRFSDCILKLNKNVIHICFSQLINPRILKPMQTLQNLDMCLSDSNPFLGHIGSFETYQIDMESFFPGMDHDLLEDCGFSSDDDEEYAKEEWDSLKDIEELPRDISLSEGRSSSSEKFISSSATELVTSAAASVASFWPWKKK